MSSRFQKLSCNWHVACCAAYALQQWIKVTSTTVLPMTRHCCGACTIVLVDFTQLVSGTVELYNSIRTELLPTPSKSHYTFNLRDMSKVVQGIMRADAKTTTLPQQVRRQLTADHYACMCSQDLQCIVLFEHLSRHSSRVPATPRASEGAGACHMEWGRFFYPCARHQLSGALQVLALWLHETSRVFEDRLTCREDHDWFRQRQTSLLQKHFGLAYSQVVSHERLIYGDYLVPGADLKVGAAQPPLGI